MKKNLPWRVFCDIPFPVMKNNIKQDTSYDPFTKVDSDQAREDFQARKAEPEKDEQFHVLIPEPSGKFRQCGITGNIIANYLSTSKNVFQSVATGKTFRFENGTLVEFIAA